MPAMASSMPMTSPDMGMLHLRRHNPATHLQPLQNPALIDIRPFTTALAQVEQLCLQRHQPIDPRLDVVDVLVDQRIHAFTLILRTVAKGQQAADFLEGHVEGAAVADEGQAFGVGLGIDAVVAVAAGRLRQDVVGFVVADGLSVAVGDFGEFSNLHDGNLQMGA